MLYIRISEILISFRIYLSVCKSIAFIGNTTQSSSKIPCMHIVVSLLWIIIALQVCQNHMVGVSQTFLLCGVEYKFFQERNNHCICKSLNNSILDTKR